MNIKPLKSIVVSVCLGCRAFSLALAQPVITTQPSDQFLAPGATAIFSVSATGAGPLTYQWLFDGAAMAGATNRVLGIADPQPAQWGYYSAIVSNASGSVASQVAELKVFVAAPHNLSGIQAESSGAESLTFNGETSASFGRYYDLYPLETSPNLVDWAPLLTLQRTNAALDTLRFVDTNAPDFTQRFYRTAKSPLPTPDPQPTGPYPVGTFSMVLTDPSRTNSAGRTNYQFMTTFWYPRVAQAGVLPAKYVEPAVAEGEGYGNFATQVEGFFSHSLLNAGLATNSIRYPVVLYDPGYGGHRRENTDKAEDLASWGYIVVGLDTSDTYVSVFPNGRVVNGQTPASTVAQLDAVIEGRLLDVEFVLDQLANLDADDPRLAGRLDLDHIGAFGWSIGGSTVAQLCLRDPRCKAGAGFDWNFCETNLLTQPLSAPYLFFRSDFGPDPALAWYARDGHPDDRFVVYNEQVTNMYWVRLASTMHESFMDYPLILDSASFAAVDVTPMSGQYLPPARLSQIVRAYLLSFFNKFLHGLDDHLLDGPSPVYPEVLQFLSKSSLSVPLEYPSAALVQGSDGNFYGTTEYGGTNGNNGTVFQMTPAGTLMTLVSFNGANGSHPVAALVQGSDGNFYGTTEYGGTNGNNGTVFQITPAGTLTTLASFNKTAGSAPLAALVQGSDGILYGTTSIGGDLSVNLPSGFGTVFKVTPAGVLTTLVSFNGSKGGNPAGGLVLGANGNFYGTTSVGGNLGLNDSSGFGTVFTMTPGGVLRTLVSFNLANGYNPSAGLVQGSDGNFYGTTGGGGAGGGGTVFEMTPAGVLTTLVSFSRADGINPRAALVQGSDGNFYGTTEFGGAGGRGTVFKVTPAGVLTTLVSFSAN